MRPAYLAEACGGDDALREEVESLLASDQRAKSFLEAPAVVRGDDARDQATLMMEGQRLGVYQVQALLGAGGMGEVYRARDTKLERDVAVKFLPHAFTSNPERLARFEREARMLAALNHPNIGAIYGFEEVEGIRFLVLELVDGQTLADTLADVQRQRSQGPGLPIRDALSIARQIAEALDIAHEKGIIHRDLKPANITITRDGVVKVLDFGLAKAARDGSTPDLTHSPTKTVNHTSDGAVMGTPGYMSPEQARGLVVDKRTDIWAFGCVPVRNADGARRVQGRDGVGHHRGRPRERARVGRSAGRDTSQRSPAAAAMPGQGSEASFTGSRRRTLRDRRRREPRRASGTPTEPRVPSGSADCPHVRAARRRCGRVLSRETHSAGDLAIGIRAAHGLYRLGHGAQPVTGRAHGGLQARRHVVLEPRSDLRQAASERRVGTAHDLRRAQVRTGVHTGRISGRVYTGGFRAWDTWTVPVLGGQPVRLLPNASGLTWIADHLVLFSEIKTGLHMGIVTATDGRADSREIYIQPDEHAMAHYSYASPDRQWVLVVEMSGAHAFTQPCRLIPFDGSSAGRQVGPQGTCLSAAWSPDGRWMYFGAVVGGNSHLWRQRFPDGAPEQITFGPLEEEGIALAPDGRSLVTSVGMRRSAVWIHDAAGERAIVSEGYALAPRFSRDGTRVFYLFARDWWLAASGWITASADLRSVDLASGKSDTVLSGQSVTAYVISRDEKDVAFTTRDGSGESQIWLAPLDRRTPPRLIARAGDQVSFGPPGELIFRSLGEGNALVRIKTDGTGRERISTESILNKRDVSPDGKWVIISAPGTTKDAVLATLAVPINGGVPKTICYTCSATWSPDGTFFYVGSDRSAFSTSTGRTLAIPVPAGKSLPDLPVAGINVADGAAWLAGAVTIENGLISPGPDPSIYVFTRTDSQRNLFRIPLH